MVVITLFNWYVSTKVNGVVCSGYEPKITASRIKTYGFLFSVATST